jgi:hypothetical protein
LIFSLVLFVVGQWSFLLSSLCLGIHVIKFRGKNKHSRHLKKFASAKAEPMPSGSQRYAAGPLECLNAPAPRGGQPARRRARALVSPLKIIPPPPLLA